MISNKNLKYLKKCIQEFQIWWAKGNEKPFPEVRERLLNPAKTSSANGSMLSHLAAAEERQPFEQMHVLLVFQQRAVQRRNQLARIAFPEHFRRDVLVEQQLEPVQKLRGRRFLLQARHFPHLEEDPQRLFHHALLDAGEMHVDDLVHGVDVGELDVVEKTTAQERVRQFLFVVRGDHHDRANLGLDALAGLVDEKLHAIEFKQQIVGKLDIGLVDFVDQQYRPLVMGEGFPQFAALDVVGDV